MEIIKLIQQPNQSFNISLSGDFYEISIKESEGIMAASITRNDVVLITGMRIVSGFFIIPFKYLESGNFAITTENEEYPDYRRFGIDQFLAYFTQEELDNIRELEEDATT